MTYIVGAQPVGAFFTGSAVAAEPALISQTLTTVVDVTYVVSVRIHAYTSGSITVKFGGSAILSTLNTVATHTASVVAASTSSALVIEKTSDWVGSIDDVTCRSLYWRETGIVKDSLILEGVSDSDTPNRIIVQYTVPEAGTPEWVDATSTYTLPDAEAGSVPLVESTVSLPGIFRAEEAAMKAQSRALRMVNRVRATWVTTDRGLSLQRGTVVQLDLPYRGVDMLVLVDSVRMVSYGRYQVSGLRYDDAHYPADVPAPVATGTVPVGAVVMISDTNVPAGWAEFTAANNKYIMIADATESPSLDVGATGGSSTYAGFSGSTASGGAHNGQSDTSFLVESYTGTAGSGSGAFIEADSTQRGGHTHTYSTGAVSPSPRRRKNILIEKTGSTSATFPANSMVFGLPGLLHADLSRSVAYAGRLLMAGSSNANQGSSVDYVSITTGSTSDAHDHFTSTTINNGSPDDIGVTDPRYTAVSGGGAHTHSLVLSMLTLPKKYTVALYSASGEFEVIPGVIVLWTGSMVSLPTDWYLCDGLNDTPDLRRHFIEISSSGGEGVSSGSNTLSISGTTAAGGSHSHISNYTTVYTYATQTQYHANNKTHTHTIASTSASYTLPYYVLGAIMYNP